MGLVLGLEREVVDTCKCVIHLLSHHAPTGAWYFVDIISSNIIVIACTSGMRL